VGDAGGKTVVVTGASKGIGRATTEAFVDQGAHVVMLARGAARLHAEAARLGDRATPIRCDISKPDDVRAAFAEVERRFGKLDVLVNNAGVGGSSPIDEIRDEDVDAVFGTNIFGALYCTRSAIPLLEAAGGGDIVNVGSEAICDPPPPLMSLYSTSKHALAAFSRYATRELRSRGIRVTHCLVGRTDTEFSSATSPEQGRDVGARLREERYFEMVTGVTSMDPADVAATITFIVSRPRTVMVDTVHVRARV
jgi:NAD(P)-dependent dehydrogenase (short-subunit alcohol dehydrogenase family)